MTESPTFVEQAAVLNSPLAELTSRLNALSNSVGDVEGDGVSLSRFNGQRRLLFTLDCEELRQGDRQTQKFFRDLGHTDGSSVILTLRDFPEDDPRSVFTSIVPPVNEAHFETEMLRVPLNGKVGDDTKDNDLWWIRQEVGPVNAIIAYSGELNKIDKKVTKDSEVILKADSSFDHISVRGSFSYPPRMFESDSRLATLMGGLTALFEDVISRRRKIRQIAV